MGLKPRKILRELSAEKSYRKHIQQKLQRLQRTANIVILIRIELCWALSLDCGPLDFPDLKLAKRALTVPCCGCPKAIFETMY